jgi:hypothetical protein
MNGVSKRWSAWALYREALTDLQWVENTELHIMSLAIVNRAVEDVLAQIFPAVFPLYLKSEVVVPASGGNHSVSGTGAWVAATKRLVFGAMESGFADSDVDKLISFVISSDCYVGVIVSRVSATTVVVDGSFLPATNGTVSMVVVVPTRLSAYTADISALSISNLEGARIVVESSSIDQPCEALSVDRLRNFRSSGLDSAGKIVYAREGNSLLFRLGEDVASVGTLTVHYPRTNVAAESDADMVDLPDGGALRLGLLRVKTIIAERLNRELNLAPEMSEALKDVFGAAQMTLSAEENKKKVEALT